MKETTRNMAVGLTVLVALVLLGGMILIFTGLPSIFRPGYYIRILAENTHDSHEGDPVHLAGMRIGRVTDIRFTDQNDPGKGVTFVIRIEQDIKLPGNTEAYFYTKGIVGSPYIELKAEGAYQLDPNTGQTLAFLPTDGSAVIRSVHDVTGLIPKELTDAIKSFSKLADNLNVLVAPGPEGASQPATGATTLATTGPDQTVRSTVAKLNMALDSFTAVFGDIENQRNIKASLANLNKATAAASEAMASLRNFANEATRASVAAQGTITGAQKNIDQVAQRLIRTADNISDLTATINRITMKMDTTNGTAGKLLNDPELYNNLVAVSRELARLTNEARDLIKTWQTSGVPLKLR